MVWGAIWGQEVRRGPRFLRLSSRVSGCGSCVLRHPRHLPRLLGTPTTRLRGHYRPHTLPSPPLGRDTRRSGSKTHRTGGPYWVPSSETVGGVYGHWGRTHPQEEDRHWRDLTEES